MFGVQWSIAVKDTIDEFQEAAKAAAATNASKSTLEGASDSPGLDEQFSGLNVSDEGAGEENECDFDFDDMDQEYSPSELRCVQASVDILRVFRRCLKAANDALNTLDSAQAQEPKQEGWLEERLEWAQAMQSCLGEANDCVGEVGILLYPPLNAEDMSGRVDELGTNLTAFCDVFYADGGIGNAGNVGEINSSLRLVAGEKLGALRVALAQL